MEQIAERLAIFEGPYDTIAEPFDWRSTRDYLNRFLERFAGRDPLARRYHLAA